MRKILLIGNLNRATQNLYESLDREFQVQLSTEQAENVRGLMKITRPDLVVVCLIGMYEPEQEVFRLLSESFSSVPVLIIGTEEECSQHMKYRENSQFDVLYRPIIKRKLLQKCYEKLRFLEQLDLEERTEEFQEEQAEPYHVLVIDDSPLLLRNIKGMLSDRFQVSVATSGEQGMKFMKKRLPDVVLLDYDMPGCDGRKTLEMIQQDEILRDIPVIFLTGVADKEHILAVLQMNPAGYFLKPPDKERLIEAIYEVLEKGHVEGEDQVLSESDTLIE